MSDMKSGNQNDGDDGKKSPPPRPSFLRLAMFLGLGYLMFSYITSDDSPPENQVPYSDFEELVETGEIDKVVRSGTVIEGFDESDELEPDIPEYTAVVPTGTDVYQTMKDNGVEYTETPPAQPSMLFNILLAFGPLFLIFGLIYLMMSKAGGLGSSLGKSKAKRIESENVSVSFDDIAGVEEAKEEVGELVDFLKNPGKYAAAGAKMPKGALLVGPPGTGKTLLARAVAGEAGVPFYYTSGSEFVEMFVGMGAARVRDLFENAKKEAPCVIFIDEIDAVGGKRGGNMGGGSHNEREQTLNAILTAMDGFEDNPGVIVLAATNTPDDLDPALLRPGRFDRQVEVGYADVEGRKKILTIHMKNKPLDDDVSVERIAKATPGLSGAELENIANEAAIQAVRNWDGEGVLKIKQTDFDEAVDREMFGIARKSAILTPEGRKKIAEHEAGHAVLGLLVPGNDPLHKVTIMPRGRAMGYAVNVPDHDRWGYSEKELKGRMVMTFGGRVAEEIIYGKEEITTGAGSDIQQATSTARRMVTEFGMSDLGRVRFAQDQGRNYLGAMFQQSSGLSEDTKMKIDAEVLRLVTEAEDEARRILTENLGMLETLAEALLEHETLSGDDITDLLGLPRQKKPQASPSAANNNDPEADEGTLDVGNVTKPDFNILRNT